MLEPVPRQNMLSPARIGKYPNLGEIGRGQMGVVYRALDPVLERAVAIKVMNQAMSGRRELRTQFEREAKTVARLQHPNIVTVHELGYDDTGHPFIVMELLEGEDLESRMSAGPISLMESLDIIAQAASGLKRAHDRGLVHRDIKAANVFLTNDGTVKVTDFGIAHLASADHSGAPETATMEYASPEELRGEAVDHRTDVYSLGVLLYRLLTGQRLDAPNALLQGEERGRSAGESGVDSPTVVLVDGRRIDELERIVLRALAEDPRERFPRVADMREALLHFARTPSAELHLGSEDGSRTHGREETSKVRRARLERLLAASSNAKDFPILRHTAVELMGLEDDVSAQRVAEVVGRDQALSTELLRVANSAYFNRSNRSIDAVSRAVVVMGTDLVKNVCLGLGFADVLGRGNDAVDLRRISAQGFFSACLGRELSRASGHSSPEEVFTCALLHNLPDMAVAYHQPELHLRLRQEIESGAFSAEQAEIRALGEPFRKIGKRIAQAWQLPRSIVEAIGASEDVVRARARTEPAVTFASTYLAKVTVRDLLCPASSNEEESLSRILQDVERSLGILPDSFLQIVERAHRSVTEQAEAFGITRDMFRLPASKVDGEPTLRAELVEALMEFFDAPPIPLGG